MDDIKDITDWFGPKTKPRRIGVYQRDYGNGRHWYSYWNGSYWGYLCAFYNHAVTQRFSESIYQELPWRGYTRNPE